MSWKVAPMSCLFPDHAAFLSLWEYSKSVANMDLRVCESTALELSVILLAEVEVHTNLQESRRKSQQGAAKVVNTRT
jgi:hypothetical protein